jgi:hypothetical protein
MQVLVAGGLNTQCPWPWLVQLFTQRATPLSVHVCVAELHETAQSETHWVSALSAHRLVPLPQAAQSLPAMHVRVGPQPSVAFVQPLQLVIPSGLIAHA